MLQLLSPPAAPVEPARAEDLDATEARLGLALPPDYRAFVSRFGSGSIGGFLHIRKARVPNWYPYPGSMSAFLAALVGRQIEIPTFPDAVFAGRAFVPI